MKTTIIACLLCSTLSTTARNTIHAPQIKTLQTIVNDDWLALPVMHLGTDDVLCVSFDELSHSPHRYIYRLEHCEADWSPSTSLFDSDWLEGFNNNPIEDYEHSLNTTVLYTHYQLSLPNERCRLKMSGNYRLYVYDEDDTDTPLLTAEFRVVNQQVNVGLSVTTNTDVDFNRSHQQVSMTLNYRGLPVTRIDEQLYTVVMQNGRENTQRTNIRPTAIQMGQLQWEHCRDLIFDAGNEYRKYEILALSHPTMGIEHMRWDGQSYQAFPFVSAPRPSYIYDHDANGAFLIRNSDNYDIDRTCDYVWVNYQYQGMRRYPEQVVIEGRWTSGPADDYVMHYDEASQSYHARILQKQGYYSYQFQLCDDEGHTRNVPEEGSFFETENTYQAFVYYKGVSDRTWQLVGYQQLHLK